MAKLSQLCCAVFANIAGLPPSLRGCLRENLLSARAFIAKRLAKAVFGAAFIAQANAVIAPRPASLTVSGHAGSVLAVPCIKLWGTLKMSLRYIGSENAIFTTSGQIFFDFAQSLRHRLLRAPEHAGRLRL